MKKKVDFVSFSDRKAPSRYALAVRHMFLERIKNLLFELQKDIPKENSFFERKLVKIALGLSVRQYNSNYEVFVQNTVCVIINQREFSLYVRGDNARAIEAQKESMSASVCESDPILQMNGAVISKYLNIIISKVSDSESD